MENAPKVEGTSSGTSALDDELEHLPRPDCTYADHSYPAYSAKAMRDAINAEREKIAAWIEPQRNDIPATGAEFAAAIRAI